MRLIALVFFSVATFAQQADQCDFHKEYQRKNAEAHSLLQQKQFSKAASILEELYRNPAVSFDEEARINVPYNLACIYALAGDKDRALQYLRNLPMDAIADVNGIERDSDLDSLRKEPAFAEFLETLRGNAKRLQAFWESPVIKTPYRTELSEDERVAGLSILWSEAKYNFAWFAHVPDLDWDALYFEFLPKVRQAKSTLEYYRLLQRFCAQLHDGHTSVYPPQQLSDELNAAPALDTQLVEDAVLVMRVLDKKLEADGVKPGLEIVSVDGVPVKQYAAERVAPYQSASTPQNLDSLTYGIALLAGSAGSTVELGLRDADGKVVTKKITRLTSRERGRMVPVWQSFEYKLQAGNVAWVKLNTFEDDRIVADFDRAFPEIQKTEALILDVRDNGGGSSGNGWSILGYLTDKPFAASRWRTRDYRPSFRAWGTAETWHDGGTSTLAPHGKNPFMKPVVILTSPRTFSAAEDFAVVFDAMKRGKIIGEPTGGSTGQPLRFSLPGGGIARVCTKQDRYPDGKEFVGIGVRPDIQVQPKVADVRAGKDAVLEAALAFLGRH